METENDTVVESVNVVPKRRGRPPKVRPVSDESIQTVVESAKVIRKPPTKFKLAEKAVKKYNKIVGKQQEAVEKAVSRVKEKFVQKKAEFLDTLTDEVRVLVEADINSVYVAEEAVVNPDVSEPYDDDQETDESSSGEVAAE